MERFQISKNYGRHNFYDLGNILWKEILLGMNLLDKNFEN